MITADMLGCHIIPAETERMCQALEDSGVKPFFADAAPQFHGYWKAQGEPGVFLWDWETALLGKFLPQWYQARGTCTGQAFGRGTQDAVNLAAWRGSKIGKVTYIAYEPLYAGSRTARDIGNSSLGGGDGSCVAWLAMYGYLYGLLERGVYGSLDLREPREDLAIAWGQPRSQVPAGIVSHLQDHKYGAAMRCRTLDDVADAIASDRPCMRGADRATGAKRDANGMAGTVSCGGHCQLIRAVFKDKRGDRCWVEQQSWRGATSAPHGGGTLKLYDGSERELPDGAGGIRDEDVQYYLKHGEIWAIDSPLQLWRAA